MLYKQSLSNTCKSSLTVTKHKRKKTLVFWMFFLFSYVVVLPRSGESLFLLRTTKEYLLMRMDSDITEKTNLLLGMLFKSAVNVGIYSLQNSKYL